MDKDFLLETETAKKLFHDYAEKTPILDYHCHINPKEIAEDRQFDNITQVWLGGDHYKWRLMRCAGVPEKYITGKETSDYEKFVKWAEVIGKSIGNPLYHWSHLELRRFFGYEGTLSARTADEVWNLCNRKLQSPGYSVRGLIAMSNVETICTTDDPIDTLEWHQKLAADDTFHTVVLPAWRPDKAMNLEQADYPEYLSKLSAASGVTLDSFRSLKDALRKRMDRFAQNRCCLSDHALNYVMYAPASKEKVEAIFRKRLAGDAVTEREQAIFKTAFMLFVAHEYRQRNWTMQLHYGCRRDNNRTMYDRMGPDTGFDCIDNYAPSSQTAAFLGALEAAGDLPQTVLYSLNPNDNQAIDSICGCFQSEEAVSKIQHGSAWWFNDHKLGMQDQLSSLANLGNLSGFVGMLTDSRSFLSYTRHDYFRRILCDLFGTWVENGEYPADYETLEEIIKDICYNNAVRYFGFEL